MIVALLIIAAYLTGAFPTSYVVGRVTRGIDLRQHGSGNLGATNAFRVLGWRAATPIFIVDIAKGFVPTWLFPSLDGAEPVTWALAYGAAAIVGHMYSIYVGFRGGKGVATGAGVFLGLAPIAALGSLAVWIVLVTTTGYVSLASIAAAASLPLFILLLGAPGSVLALSVALATFVIYAHRANIGRLRRGQEHRFGKRGSHAEAAQPGGADE